MNLARWEPDTLGGFLKSCGLPTKPWTHVLALLSLTTSQEAQAFRGQQSPCLECEKFLQTLEMPFFFFGVGEAAGRLTREEHGYGVKGNGSLISVLPEAMALSGNGFR